ncbi:twin-arginine translocase TatA/TatE family subunit [bacterium]|nr:twin-arginine translocase TatA/TatE family subunit [bacterium]
MVGEFSLFHWLVVFAIVLVVFGPNKLPELAKAAGKGIRDFKKALNEDENEIIRGSSTIAQHTDIKSPNLTSKTN